MAPPLEPNGLIQRDHVPFSRRTCDQPFLAAAMRCLRAMASAT
jgi:hypothetical protein